MLNVELGGTSWKTISTHTIGLLDCVLMPAAGQSYK